jgi:hypothetical protein
MNQHNLQGQMEKIQGSLPKVRNYPSSGPAAAAEYSSRKRQRRGEQRQLVAVLDMLLPPEARKGGEICRNLSTSDLRSEISCVPHASV